MKGFPLVLILLCGVLLIPSFSSMDGMSSRLEPKQDVPAVYSDSDTVRQQQGGLDLQGTTEADTLRGGPGNDALRGLGGDDLLEGRAGEDALDGGEGDDDLNGGDGNDVLNGQNGADVLEGGDGNDHLVGGDAADWLFGGDGDDILQGGAEDDVLEGGNGADVLDGGDGDDILEGEEGDDMMVGGEGDDTMDGGDGNNSLHGGPGNDFVTGRDDGDHVLIGGDGDDTLIGAQGSDNLDGGGGNDLLFGGDQNDVVRGGPGNDVVGGGDEDDMLDGGPGNDLMSGGEGDDIMRGGPGNDTLLASEGRDDLQGGGGDDVLRGGSGDDVLHGEAGNDRLLGGLGTDHVLGGVGRDAVLLRRGDVDSARLEVVDGGTDPDTVPSADTLVLHGFTPPHVTPSEAGHFTLKDPLTGGTYSIARFERIVYAHFFPHIGSSDGRSAMLRLINPSKNDSSYGRVDFAADDGTPLAVSVDGNPSASSFAFGIPPLGSVRLALDGAGDPLAGAVRLEVDRPLGGVMRAELPELGWATVGESPLVDAFVVPAAIDRINGVTTGIAVRNSSVETALKLTLRRLQGPEVEATEIDVPVNGHAIRFMHELFPQITEFEGTLTVEGGPVVGTGIHVGPGRGDFTTFPVIPLALQLAVQPPSARPLHPAGEPLYFAHVANGDEFVYSIVLLNPSFPDTTRGSLAFLDDDGNELEMDLVGFGPVTSVPFELGPGRVAVFTTGGKGAFVDGSARALVSKGWIGGVLRFSVPGGGFAGLGPSRPLDAFISPVTRSERQGLTTLVTLHSTGSALTVNLVLRRSDGMQIPGATTEVRIPANGRVARSLEALFPNADTRELDGTMTVTVEGGTVAATVMQLGTQRDRVLVMPVMPLH